MTTSLTQAAGQTVASYSVSGMTCGHCVSSVTAEVSKLPGVANVEVDLASGTVTVTSQAALEEAAVAAAVTEAGYDLVPAAKAEPSTTSCCGTCH